MKSKNGMVLCALVFCVWLALDRRQEVNAASVRQIAFGVGERQRLDNSLYYTVSVGDSPFPLPPQHYDGRIEQFVLPGGHILNRLDEPNKSFESLEFNSFNEVAQAIFGQWQFKTADAADPLNSETYLFSVQPFALGDITVVRPPIFEPANGAIVYSPFQIKFTNPSGYLIRGKDVNATIDSPGSGVIDVFFTEDFLTDESEIYFETSRGGSINQFVTQPISSPGSEYDLSVRGTFGRISSITVYPRAVPEPDSLLILTISTVSLIAGFHGKRACARN